MPSICLNMIVKNESHIIKKTLINIIKYVKIKFCRQLPTKYPQFAFYCNLPQYIKDPYKRFLENQIRKNYDFSGVPIDIFLRKK